MPLGVKVTTPVDPLRVKVPFGVTKALALQLPAFTKQVADGDRVGPPWAGLARPFDLSSEVNAAVCPEPAARVLVCAEAVGGGGEEIVGV